MLPAGWLTLLGSLSSGTWLLKERWMEVNASSLWCCTFLEYSTLSILYVIMPNYTCWSAGNFFRFSSFMPVYNDFEHLCTHISRRSSSFLELLWPHCKHWIYGWQCYHHVLMWEFDADVNLPSSCVSLPHPKAIIIATYITFPPILAASHSSPPIIAILYTIFITPPQSKIYVNIRLAQTVGSVFRGFV